MSVMCLLLVVGVLQACGDNKSSADNFESETTKISTLFEEEFFESDTLRDLLLELNICSPMASDSLAPGTVECSPKFFAFYNYNHKRTISDAFLLQVKKGVNNYPYRRLLIFVRERGQLVLVTGVVGYLVEKRTTKSGIDDLVVAVVDNIGGHYERYDVLLKYKEGKYHFEEAIGDLQGVFEDEELKKRATKMIGERIKEKKLIF
jgi:hypothetical protein